VTRGVVYQGSSDDRRIGIRDVMSHARDHFEFRSWDAFGRVFAASEWNQRILCAM